MAFLTLCFSLRGLLSFCGNCSRKPAQGITVSFCAQ